MIIGTVAKWGHGYYSSHVPNEYNTEYNSYSTFYNYSSSIKGFWSCNPSQDVISKMIRAHIHAYGVTNQSAQLDIAKAGIDYLLGAQRPDGGFYEWTYRLSQNSSSNASTSNVTHLFATSYSLRALCEFYLASNNSYISNNSTYKMSIYNAITNAANFVVGKIDLDSSNYNYSALCAWGLASAYKVTLDCSYLNGAITISQYLVDHQTKTGTAQLGEWENRQEEPVNGGANFIWHDTKIGYHMIILRGMIETLDITPNARVPFKDDLTKLVRLRGELIMSSTSG